MHLGIGRVGGDKEFRGYIDEFYIYNKTLSDIELKILIDSCKDMVLHLSFEKIKGYTTFDSSGLNNDAVMTKGSVVQTGTPPPPVCEYSIKLNCVLSIYYLYKLA